MTKGKTTRGNQLHFSTYAQAVFLISLYSRYDIVFIFPRLSICWRISSSVFDFVIFPISFSFSEKVKKNQRVLATFFNISSCSSFDILIFSILFSFSQKVKQPALTGYIFRHNLLKQCVWFRKNHSRVNLYVGNNVRVTGILSWSICCVRESVYKHGTQELISACIRQTFIVCSPICPDNCGVAFLWKCILVFEKLFFRSTAQICKCNEYTWPPVFLST